MFDRVIAFQIFVCGSAIDVAIFSSHEAATPRSVQSALFSRTRGKFELLLQSGFKRRVSNAEHGRMNTIAIGDLQH